jgi:hypothetical protein
LNPVLSLNEAGAPKIGPQSIGTLPEADTEIQKLSLYFIFSLIQNFQKDAASHPDLCPLRSRFFFPGLRRYGS